MKGGPHFNKSGDYRDTNTFISQIRLNDWNEGQLVSLLEVSRIGKSTLRALWHEDIKTAQRLMETDAEELAGILRQYDLPSGKPEDAVASIKGWQEEAAQLWKEKEQHKENEESENNEQE